MIIRYVVNMKKKLYLVDVSSMFFRAFYAVRPLSNSKGLPTNAIYGFLSMSLRLLKESKPDYLVYCYDRPEPSFRKEIDPNYKANRGETPEDLIPQIPYIKMLTDLLGIHGVELKGFEADDLIGSLTRFGLENQCEVIIVSGDKDFAQLIEPDVKMYDTMKSRVFDVDKVREKWGVAPEQFIDYLAICGDSSDNIPGIRGIGPKGAAKLLGQFQTLDGVYENLDLIKSASVVKKLNESKENAYMSQKLVTIVQDINFGHDISEYRVGDYKKEDLGQLLDELEFSKFKKTLLGASSDSPSLEANQLSKADGVGASGVKDSTVEAQYTWIVKNRKLSEIAQWIDSGDEVFAFFSEEKLGIGRQGEISVYSDDLKDVGLALIHKKVKWKGYGLKGLWRQLGVPGGNPAWDNCLASYLVHPRSVKKFADTYLKHCQINLSEFPDWVELFQALDLLEQTLKSELKSLKLLPVLKTLDLPLVPVLHQMEGNGILLDSEFLDKESESLAIEIAAIEKEIFELSGEEFNIASPKQLAHVLFEKLSLPKGKKTKTGYSTGEEVLKKIKDKSPIPALVLKFREFSKLKSTYVDALPNLAKPETGRIHTQLNQALTTTGRLSSSSPNLQNIPIRTDRGKRVRQAFVSSPGKVLLSADYSQIELRILAHISDDQGLLEAFAEDADIHSWTARELFLNGDEGEVSSEQRRKAKAVNFGIAYGQGAFGLAETLGISRTEAKNVIFQYFEKFPGVKSYMDQTVIAAKENGYVETLFGRRRYLPELNARNAAQRAFGERAAINAPIQGTASDLVKMAMLEVFDEYPEEMLLQVHDELIFEFDEQGVEEKMQHITGLMEDCVSLKVPLKVNASWGKNWFEAH